MHQFKINVHLTAPPCVLHKVHVKCSKNCFIEIPPFPKNDPHSTNDNNDNNNSNDNSMNIQCYHLIDARRPNMIVVNKGTRKCMIIRLSDSKLSDKEKEKMEKYQDLQREIKKIQNMGRVIVIFFLTGFIPCNSHYEVWSKEKEAQKD